MTGWWSKLAAGLVVGLTSLSLAPAALAQVTTPVVSIEATDRRAAEPGRNTATFTVGRTGDTATAITVGYRVTGTAASGTDFTPLSGSVGLGAGVTRATITVTPLDDLVEERRESVIVTLVGGTGYTLGTDNAARVWIRDNDGEVRDRDHRRGRGDMRPGWGRGDDNHEHFGPPGHGCSGDEPCRDATHARGISSLGNVQDHDDKDHRKANRGRGRR